MNYTLKIPNNNQTAYHILSNLVVDRYVSAIFAGLEIEVDSYIA